MRTALTELLGIEHPIIQAGMGGPYTNAELVSAVSAAGGLGILGSIAREQDEVVRHVREIPARTDRPFGVNFVFEVFDEQTFQTCLDERAPVFSFFRGDPAADLAPAVRRVHDVGSVVIHQVTTVDEAARAIEAGVDVVVAQGVEAGGHHGFVPLTSIVSDVVALAGTVPIVAAGGIVDGRGLAAALALGASGVLMGTRFLATTEASTTPTHRQAIVDAGPEGTVSSILFDLIWTGTPWPGTHVRGLRNRIAARWAGREAELTGDVLEAARAQFEVAYDADDPQERTLMGGMGSSRIDDVLPAGDIVRRTVAEAEAIIGRLASGLAVRS